MLRPGMRNPRMGPQRTAMQKRRIMPQIKQRSPLLGGPMRRPVAGPGARWMNARQGAPLNFLQERLQALAPHGKPSMVPLPPPNPGQLGESELMPQPGVGLPPMPGEDVFHPVNPGFAPRNPTTPIAIPSMSPQIPEFFDRAQVMGPRPQGPTTAQFPAGLPSLIPLGGGQYIDPNSGQIHGLGGGVFAF